MLHTLELLSLRDEMPYINIEIWFAVSILGMVWKLGSTWLCNSLSWMLCGSLCRGTSGNPWLQKDRCASACGVSTKKKPCETTVIWLAKTIFRTCMSDWFLIDWLCSKATLSSSFWTKSQANHWSSANQNFVLKDQVGGMHSWENICEHFFFNRKVEDLCSEASSVSFRLQLRKLLIFSIDRRNDANKLVHRPKMISLQPRFPCS